MSTPPSGPAPEAATDTAPSTRPGPRLPSEAPNLLDQGPYPGTPSGEGLSADEESTLARLQAKAASAAAGGKMVSFKVEAPHSELHYGGVQVTSDWTTVPQHMASALETAAADSGVTLTKKDEG